MKQILTIIISLALFNGLFGQLVTPFTIRYQTQQKGGITFISNSTVTCDGGAGCFAGQNEVPPVGTASNNTLTAAYVDIDSDISTFSSSSDSLALPNSSQISWAGLYWGGENQPGDPSYASRDEVWIKANDNSYIVLTADELQDNVAGFSTYHCFKDITSIVQTYGPNARYTLGNVAARVGGTDQFGGWTIVVVYQNDAMNMRNLTVFNGLSCVSTSSPITDISINGFATPPSGPVGLELGMVVYDGDRALIGDQLQFNGNGAFMGIFDALNPTNDIFNGTISNNGIPSPYRNPNFSNTLGYDADIFYPDNVDFTYITNGATSAVIRQTTSGETFLTQVVTSAIDLDVSDDDNDGTLDFADLDNDNDGIPDATETFLAPIGGDTDWDGNPDHMDRDTDNDGIPDLVEAGGFDSNGDGEVDGFVDTNNNGLDDNIEANPLPYGNSDGDQVWNAGDLDSDNDGITDVREALGSDPDNNGQIGTGIGTSIPDTDDDGLSNVVDTDNGGTPLLIPNTDSNGYPDYQDIDSDQDGIVDNIEGQSTQGYIAPNTADTDADGLTDLYDGYSGFGGNGVVPVNTESNGLADYRDTDSDNDGDLDALEGWDSDNDGTADVMLSGNDLDMDGLDNAYDNNDASWQVSNGQTPASFPNLDIPTTTERDWREQGFVAQVDTDDDGVVDGNDVDDDNDGLPDIIEMLTALNVGDTDNDNIPDIHDLDSDNDGIRDVIEAGGKDPDNDGIIGTGAIIDTDGDGWSDITDPDNGGTPLPNPDTDGDGLPNFQDRDSDNDTVLDYEENDPLNTGFNLIDTDGDGIPNYLDTDDDDDGRLTTNEADENGDGVWDDCDKDNLPDYLDRDNCGFSIPKGFSPNGDGINDEFVIHGLGIYDGAKLSVFNRWGNLVFQEDNYNNDWNGVATEGATLGGGPLPVGTYFYVLELGDMYQPQSGYIYINR